MQDAFNLLSPNFDPELALSAKDVPRGPFPNERPLDNVAACKALLPKAATPEYMKKGSKHCRARPAGEPSSAAVTASVEASSSAHKADQPKALIVQWRDSFKDGPISLLRRLHHRPVRVVVRRQYGVRGWCEGQLQLFDRHMNLVLLEVTEHFVLPAEEDGCEHDGWQQRCAVAPRARNGRAPIGGARSASAVLSAPSLASAGSCPSSCSVATASSVSTRRREQSRLQNIARRFVDLARRLPNARWQSGSTP